MKNTKNITITRKANTVYAPYLPYAAYKRAIELATALKGKIGKTADGNFMATFDSVKTAEKFKTEWTAEYEANRKVEPIPAPAQKPKASKGDKPFVFDKIKGATNSDKNKALHKELVKMGITDSRTPEYQAVWNARPWAK